MSNKNPYERISNNIVLFHQTIGRDPDVIFITRKFYVELRHSSPNFYLKYMPKEETLFGMKFFIVQDSGLDGLDFQCFKSSHLNELAQRYKKDDRFWHYKLKIDVPTMTTWEAPISNGSPCPTANDRMTTKQVDVVATSAVLKEWLKPEVQSE